MPDIPYASIVHITSERLRIKIPSKKGAEEFFVSLKEKFGGCDGIEAVKANPLTGSVFFKHASNADAIAEYALKNKIFKLETSKPDSANLHKRVTETFNGINNSIKGFTGGDMDIAGTAFVALLGMGIYQISRGNFAAPAWYTAFWYALNIFLKAKPDKGGE